MRSAGMATQPLVGTLDYFSAVYDLAGFQESMTSHGY